MGIPVITEGAKTSHGGVISECVPTFKIHGKGVHVDGMSHECPKCGRTVSAIASNFTKSVHGKAIVLEGDKTTCGASFIANQGVASIGGGDKEAEVTRDEIWADAAVAKAEQEGGLWAGRGSITKAEGMNQARVMNGDGPLCNILGIGCNDDHFKCTSATYPKKDGTKVTVDYESIQPAAIPTGVLWPPTPSYVEAQGGKCEEVMGRSGHEYTIK